MSVEPRNLSLFVSVVIIEISNLGVVGFPCWRQSECKPVVSLMLQGGETLRICITGSKLVPEEEYFIALEGRNQRHVTKALCLDVNTLQAQSPGITSTKKFHKIICPVCLVDPL